MRKSPLLLLLILAPLACQSKPKPAPPTAPLAPAYAGPVFLHGTVSSLATIRGYEPLYVSGFGLIVNLPGTGSAEVPTGLFDWFINEMSKRGVGKVGTSLQDVNPRAMLESDTTAVVTVEGIIPPGASRGSSFDLLVTAVRQSQTTSLRHGRLWTCELTPGKADPVNRFVRPVASASGVVFIDPFDTARMSPEQSLELERQAVVLAGGTVMENRPLELVLRQPSWQRSNLLAQRINTFFRRGLTDSFETAVAQTDSLVQLNVPERFRDDTGRFLALLSYLFIQDYPGFSRGKAVELMGVLEGNPQHAQDVAMAWQGLGKTVLPVVRQGYGHAMQHVKLASLEAGARMEDEQCIAPLSELATHPDPALRRRAAELLVHLPKSLRGSSVLADLLSDEDPGVRSSAYESLTGIGDPLIRRMPFGRRDADGAMDKRDFKFALDLVPSKRPTVYVSQQGLPRIAIFDPNAGFQLPMFPGLWDNRLMIRGTPDGPLEVFYQTPGESEPKTYTLAPTIANLVLLLGHKPTIHDPTPGLDLPYSEVVDALYQLHQIGELDAAFELRRNELVLRLAQAQQQAIVSSRPETESTPPGSPPTPGSESTPAPAPAPGEFVDRPDLANPR